MRKQKKLRARIVSLAMCAAMVFTMMPGMAFATETPPADTTGLTACHTVHDDVCGYAEAVEGQDCTYVQDEDSMDEAERGCSHLQHDAECYDNEDDWLASDSNAVPLNCTHVHDDSCTGDDGDSQHEHDGECGYVEAVEASPCRHSCEVCQPQDNGVLPDNGIKLSCVCTVACVEDAVNGDCPVCMEDSTACEKQQEENKQNALPVCADSLASNDILDELLELQKNQQALIEELGTDAYETDGFKEMDERVMELWTHVDACEICLAQLAEDGLYYEKFYGVQTMADGPNDFIIYYDAEFGLLYKEGSDGLKTALSQTEYTGTYTGDGSSLTLTDFNFTTSAKTGFSIGDSLTITLVGDNEITSTYSGYDDSFGIVSRADVTIKGSGSLIVTGGTSTGSEGSSAAIYMNNNKLTIEDGDITAIGGSAADSTGITVKELAMTKGTLVAAGETYATYIITDPELSGITVIGSEAEDGSGAADVTYSGNMYVTADRKPVKYVKFEGTGEPGTLYFGPPKSDRDGAWSLYTDRERTLEYTEGAGTWSVAGETLILNGFVYSTKADTILVLYSGATISLTAGTTNTLTSTYSGPEYSIGIDAGDLTI